MRTKIIISLLVLAAVTISFGLNEAGAAVSVQVGTPNASFSISDYQPAPPNVYIQSDRGRPYYMHRNRRVYMERRHDKHYKHDKHREDRGRGDDHDRGRR